MYTKETDLYEEFMSEIHRDSFPSLITTYRWISQIQMEFFRLEKKKSPGRTASTINVANVQKARLLVEENCRLSCRDKEDITSIPKTCVHEILTGHLQLRNIY